MVTNNTCYFYWFLCSFWQAGLQKGNIVASLQQPFGNDECGRQGLIVCCFVMSMRHFLWLENLCLCVYISWPTCKYYMPIASQDLTGQVNNITYGDCNGDIR